MPGYSESFIKYVYVSKNSSQVKWNGFISDAFGVSNGVRQGGILSPLLFSIYVDDLLIELKKSGLGCHIGNRFFGALGYADDIVIFCPTKNALKKMIKICENYALEHDILFNGKKSQLLIFGEMQTQHVDIRVNGELVPLSENALHL